MQNKSIFRYFYFGTSVRYLQDVSAGYRIHDVPAGAMVLTNLDRFSATLVELGLQVTERAAESLKSFANDLRKLPQDAVLTEPQAKTINGLMQRIRPTLEAELQGFEAYVVTPKRIDVTRLLKDVPFLFASGTFSKLPDIARYDLNECGKCIAFERPTAAAFHLLRATESVLRLYYCVQVKRSRVDLMWGPMVQLLRGRAKSKEAEMLLNNLDDIRFHFRNPTQHPEKTYDVDEVQDLWGRCVDAISRMATQLP
ncbi:MAG TPA: hypothetical protein VFF64_17030 [Candidatus Eremiobacteraceae bacterium]|nr:hypothetical protein [Candidatus Eremiobacteraceae bacterium]